MIPFKAIKIMGYLVNQGGRTADGEGEEDSDERGPPDEGACSLNHHFLCI